MEEERRNRETWLGKDRVKLEGAGAERAGKAFPKVSWGRTLTACAQPHTVRVCLMLDSSWSSMCFLKEGEKL